MIYYNGEPVSVSGTTTKGTVNGIVSFADLQLYRPKVGTYSVNFSTSDVAMSVRSAPGTAREWSVVPVGVRATTTWQTGISIEVTEGAAYALELQTEPVPLVVDNAEPFATQPTIIIKDIANNQVWRGVKWCEVV